VAEWLMNHGRKIADVDCRRALAVIRGCGLFALFVITCGVVGCAVGPAELVHTLVLPEARTIDYRDPSNLPSVPIPVSAPPRTVTNLRPELTDWPLSLDDAVRIALENTRVVRVLAGVTATTSGKTIYDAAITQTTIDEAQARFDPVLTQNNEWRRRNAPSAVLNPFDPLRSRAINNAADSYLMTLGVKRDNVLGGKAALNYVENPVRFPGGGSVFNSAFPGFGLPLNPQNTKTLELSYTQPLLQGAGFRVNMAPIVIARLNTEASFFQYKDSVQEMVRGVIEAYWLLVQARTDAWARQKQVELSEFTYNREAARLDAGLADAKDVAQAKVTYTQFKANLVAAQALVLTREGALRNIIGLPPTDDRFIIPVSSPVSEHLPIDWENLVGLAEERRPDIIELKIILEADAQRLLQAENQMLPKLDAVGAYQFNGLTGTMPSGEILTAAGSRFPGYTLGINFSVPLYLRQGRAQVRQEKLIIERDRANLQQGLHQTIHELAITARDLDNAYAQYLAFKETRQAAEINVKVQDAQFSAGRAIYLNVLQALNDWGAAISSEAGALLSYNVALAAMERRTGTILETHGLFFQEERTRFAGPLLLRKREYPSSIIPVGTPNIRPGGPSPSEQFFDLREPAPRNMKLEGKLLPPVEGK
jgi:outer membrane protein TolC